MEIEFIVMKPNQKKKRKSVELLIPIGFLIIWFVLNRWILPRFGVPT